jgi:hypothetical protein
MGCISKSFSLILILIMVILSVSLMLVSAQPPLLNQISTPSVPDFAVKFVGIGSIPLTLDTLPCVNITIKNQPFTPYTDRYGNKINLYYRIQWKENTSNFWQQDEIPLTESNSNYTILPLALIRSEAPPPKGQVDFQVEAVIGYVTYIQGSVPQGEYIPPSYTGEMSGWSDTQSIIVTNTSSSSPVLSSIDTLFSPTIILILIVVAILMAVLVVLLYEKTKN